MRSKLKSVSDHGSATIVFLVIISFSMIAWGQANSTPVPSESRQMILVLTSDRVASRGFLYCFERENPMQSWKLVAEAYPMIFGRSGLGWGRGLHPLDSTRIPLKVEGDGCSPAGVFRLGEAFGFPDEQQLPGLKLPYRQVDEFLECIDDLHSAYYTCLLSSTTTDSADWNSSEHIINSPTAYFLGVVIEHNTENPLPGAGSCIFLHVWTAPDDSTAGCTTLAKAAMENIVHWLDAAKHPVVVQLWEVLYQELRVLWQLPSL
jgi:D-alanyl-D-alanine dipeptidase